MKNRLQTILETVSLVLENKKLRFARKLEQEALRSHGQAIRWGERGIRTGDEGALEIAAGRELARDQASARANVLRGQVNDRREQRGLAPMAVLPEPN